MPDEQENFSFEPAIRRTVDLAAELPEQHQRITQVLLLLNQLQAYVAGEHAQREATRALEQLFEQLTQLAGAAPQHKDYVQQTIQELMRLAQQAKLYEHKAHRQRPISPEQGPTYYRRHGPRGLRLVESRPGSQKDFYLTPHDYDLAIDALAKLAEGQFVHFDQVHRRFVELGGADVKSAYPLRVALRFLRSRQPPLIEAHRARYRLLEKPAAFRKQAKQAWEDLPER